MEDDTQRPDEQDPSETQSEDESGQSQAQETRQRLATAKRVTQLAKRTNQIQQGAKAARLALAAATSETIIVPLLLLLANKKNARRLFYVILGIVLFILFYLTGGFDTTTTNNASVSLTKVAPTAVPNDQNITYSLNGSYTGSPSQIIVTDTIPDNASFVSAGQNAQTLDSTGNPTTDPTKIKTVKWIISVMGGGGGTTNPSTGLPSPNASSFEELMKGQARNTGVMGNEDNFVTTIFTNVNPARPLSNKSTYESYLRQLYKASVAKNINPLIPLAIWGVESTYTISSSGSDFGCKPFGTSHETQLTCSLEVLDKWIKVFEDRSKNGLPVFLTEADLGYTPKAQCPFNDAVPFAYEAYTPVCTLSDQNDEARTNFVILIKDFVQAGAQ